MMFNIDHSIRVAPARPATAEISCVLRQLGFVPLADIASNAKLNKAFFREQVRSLRRRKRAGAMITRRGILAAGVGLATLAATGRISAQERKETMQVTRSGSQPSTKGSAEYFTGSVRIDSRFQGTAPARVGGAIVTFEPGARTAWHTHPLGQTLIVTSGCGWAQVEGGAKEEIRPGDVVWFAPGEKHWHGASATAAMSHIAIAEALDGKSVDWMEQVSDEQYRA
jgi:quercetin dioxygenase-like cupin family protein